MSLLAQREAALVGALQQALPGVPVRAALAPWPRGDRAEPITERPEIRVILRRVLADGVMEWLVQVIVPDLRGPHDRRATLLPFLGIVTSLPGYLLREARAGHADDRAAGWEVTLAERPAGGSDPRPPMIASRLLLAGSTNAATAPGDTILPGIAAVAAGTRLLAHSGGTWRDLGVTGAGGHLALPLEAALPAGTIIRRAEAPAGFPATLSSIQIRADTSAAMHVQRTLSSGVLLSSVMPVAMSVITQYRDITISSYRELMRWMEEQPASSPVVLLGGGMRPLLLVPTRVETRLAADGGRLAEVEGHALEGQSLAAFQEPGP